MLKSILDIQEKLRTDDSIRRYEEIEYQPIVGTQLNIANQITITIENTDDFYHPHLSCLEVEGRLLKADGTGYADNDMVTLSNNALMYLFSNARYCLNGTEIESINHPGQASTILGSVKYTPAFKDGPGLMQCWYPDTTTNADEQNVGFRIRQGYIIQKSNPKGTFSMRIPLKHIFGFIEDDDKIKYGFTHQLILTRTTDSNDSIFKNNAAALGKVELTKVSWIMPRVELNDEARFNLYKIIESKATLESGYRMRQCCTMVVPETTSTSWRLQVKSAPEKPRWILLVFQTDKKGDQTKNASLFDHCNLTNMCVQLNAEKYPRLDANADFDKMRFSQFYMDMVEFTRDYYGVDPLINNVSMRPSAFKELTPVFVSNLTKQNERLDRAILDITINMEFKVNVPANTHAYALIISDKDIKFKSDGRKMTIV